MEQLPAALGQPLPWPACSVPKGSWELVIPEGAGVRRSPEIFCLAREETEIIEGEVVEIQIDRPATGTVSMPESRLPPGLEGQGVRSALRSKSHGIFELQIGTAACLQ